MRLVIVWGFLLAASTARADSDAETKALVQKQVAALVAGDAHAFAETMAWNAVAFFPIAAAEGFDQTEIEAAAKRWLATLPARTFKLEKLRVGGATYVADLVGVGKPLRISGVVAPMGDMPDGPAHVIATHIDEPITDKALASAKLPKLPAVPKEAGKKKPPVGLANAIGHWTPHAPGWVVVIGSAPSESATDGKAAQALLKTWEKLSIDVLGEVHVLHGPNAVIVSGRIHVVAGHVRIGKVPMRVVLAYDSAGQGDGEVYPGRSYFCTSRSRQSSRYAGEDREACDSRDTRASQGDC